MSIKASPALNASGVSKSTPKPKSAKKLKPALSNANSATPKSIVTSADEVTKLSMSTSKPAKTPKSAITPKGVSSPKTEGMELATPKLAKTGDGNSPGLPVKELKKSGKKTCDSSKNGSEKENNVESTSSVVVVNKRKSVDAGVKDDGASEITSVKKARKSALATPKVSQNGGKEVAPKSVKASPVVPMITPPGAKRVLRSKSRNTAKKASPKSA
ncbi:hypothetical protein EB796_011181 [Bugula neritina]|uniref:Uncharacterized protein n=1 Tax=Bugula neritina TaxID=10212 RepID=A0A7J7JVV0_BUGNE|nr:hypothetical protein EB796_011181 [Bugula neritina]